MKVSFCYLNFKHNKWEIYLNFVHWWSYFFMTLLRERLGHLWVKWKIATSHVLVKLSFMSILDPSYILPFTESFIIR